MLLIHDLLDVAGIDEAIHCTGGESIMKECKQIGGCPVRKAVITTGGNLKAKYVIHTVISVYKNVTRDEAKLLGSA